MSKLSLGWLIILLAGLLEVVWPVGIKYSQNFTRWGWLVLTAAALIASFVLMAVAVSSYFRVPVGTAYAVWTGIGAAGAAIVGMILFSEPVTPARVLCLCLIIGGVIGLKATHHELPEPPEASASQGANAAAGSDNTR
jgi:quaternary ammonium compound-resistance protein SugE